MNTVYTKSQIRERIANNDIAQYEEFSRQFRDKVANGYTKADLQTQYKVNDNHLMMFDKLKAEVDKQAQLDDAFINGFMS